MIDSSSVSQMIRQHKNKPRRVVLWLTRSVIVATVITLGITLWFDVVIDIHGVDLRFINADGNYTAYGLTITYTVVILIVVLTVFVQMANNHLERIHAREALIIAGVNNCIESIYDKNLESLEARFYEWIDTKAWNGKFRNYDQADIYQLLELTRNIIGTVYGIENEDISVSVMYNHVNVMPETEWHSLKTNLVGVKKDNDENDKWIINDEESFGYFVLSYTKDFYICHNKKRDGANHRDHGRTCPIYTMNKRDTEMQGKCIWKKYGSIAGSKFAVDRGEEAAIKAMIFISTYGKMLDRSLFGIRHKRVDTEISKVILPIIQKAIKMQLMRMYIAMYCEDMAGEVINV
jgi:hypothetical protein